MPNFIASPTASTSGTGYATISVTATTFTGDSHQILTASNSEFNVSDTTYLHVFNDDIDYENSYLSFRILSHGSSEYGGQGVYLCKQIESGNNTTIYYRINKGEWLSGETSYDAHGWGTKIDVDAGDLIEFKGENVAYDNFYFGTGWYEDGLQSINIFGNIMSLIYGDDFRGKTSFPGISSHNFRKLFGKDNMMCGVINAEHLILPVTNLSTECYYGMFSECSHLHTAPELPFTGAANGCCGRMFYGCSALIKAPTVLQAQLNGYDLYCYDEMFVNCSSMTTAPDLPSKHMPACGYYRMFSGCTSLNHIMCLGETADLAYGTIKPTEGWVTGVSQTGTFIKSPDSEYWTTGRDGIPSGWSVQDYSQYENQYLTFNILSAGTIVWGCNGEDGIRTISYSTDSGVSWTQITSNTGSSAPVINVNAGDMVMFKGDNANYYSYYRRSSFSGSTAKFDVEGNIMSLIDSVGFATAKTLSSASTFDGLFYRCSGLTSAENLIMPATALTEDCYNMMFQNCAGLTIAPTLPATTLSERCYYYMFANCRNLQSIKCLATDISANSCTSGWLYNVSSSGTFTKASSMSSWPTGDSGIPTGWTVIDNT